MLVLDYCTMLQGGPILGRFQVDGMYEDGDGIQLRSIGRDRGLVSEVVRLTDEALLLAGDYQPQSDYAHRQIIRDKDWLHLQFRFSASGSEIVNARDVIDLPQRTFTISHYAKDTEVTRELSSTERWTHVCLFATRKGLAELLDIKPERMDCTFLGEKQTVRAKSRPLRPSMIMSGQDILGCSLRGLSRRAFMRGKSIELVSSVLAMSNEQTDGRDAAVSHVAAKELRQIAAAEEIMALNLQSHLTLSELSRKVGMSRTKLATSFKAINGVSVQEYWRNLRLARAYKALTSSGISVTQAAFEAGYSEVSSFAKAFQARFGFLPRDCRALSETAPGVAPGRLRPDAADIGAHALN